MNLNGEVTTYWKNGQIKRKDLFEKGALIRGIGNGCDEEVTRLILDMPNGEPGKLDGENNNTIFNLPVRFTSQ